MPDQKIPCAHYASRYLPLTENWIYRLLQHHNAFSPVFLCRHKMNLNLFPLDAVHSLGDLFLLNRWMHLVRFKLTGYIPFFHQVCKQQQVSILHTHFGYHGVKMVGLAKKLNVPMVCTFYGDDAFAKKYENGYSALFKNADKILVLGPYMKARLIDLGCAESKLIVHHLGIDVQNIRFERRTRSGNRPMRFLIASSFLPKKGVDIALEALAVLRADYDFSVDIIGDGELKSEILRLIEVGNLADRVTLHGYKPYDYFVKLAFECDVFIQASRTTADNRKEGTPMAIADVMATGMPVVSTRHSDIPEMVLDGVTGYLANENDLQSLVDALKRMLEHPGSIGQFSEAGRLHIEKEFSNVIQGQRLEAIYMDLLR